MPLRSLAAGALMLALAGCAAPTPPPAAPVAAAPAPAAPAPPSVADLVDARASSGEGEMQRRGFTSARVRGLTTFWWNAAARSCVETTTANGRYRVVRPVAAASCGH
jgi:hypothetical protein